MSDSPQNSSKDAGAANVDVRSSPKPQSLLPTMLPVLRSPSKLRSQTPPTAVGSHQPEAADGRRSTTPDIGYDVDVGSRVLVGGVKSGRLHYVGKAHFAEGEWCGVELDDADGLHDGTVDNIRYFVCRSKHGIFAPRAKVTLKVVVQEPRVDGTGEGQGPQHSLSSLLRRKTGVDGGGGSPKTAAVSRLTKFSSGYFSAVVIPPKWDEHSEFIGAQLARSKPMRPLSMVDGRHDGSRIPARQKQHQQQQRPLSASQVEDIALQSGLKSSLHLHSDAKISGMLQQQRAQPGGRKRNKRVTFGDEVTFSDDDELRGSDAVAMTDESADDDETSHVDSHTALTLAYDLEFGSSESVGIVPAVVEQNADLKSNSSGNFPNKNRQRGADDRLQEEPDGEYFTSRADEKTAGDNSSMSSAELERCIDLEISDVRTPELEMSFSSSEEDGVKAASTRREKSITIAGKNSAEIAWNEEDEDGVEARATENPNDRKNILRQIVDDSNQRRGSLQESFDSMRHREDGTMDPSRRYSSAAMTKSCQSAGFGELAALKVVGGSASLELARTALAQYADLVKAAREDHAAAARLQSTRNGGSRPSSTSTETTFATNATATSTPEQQYAGCYKRNVPQEEKLTGDVGRSKDSTAMQTRSPNADTLPLPGTANAAAVGSSTKTDLSSSPDLLSSQESLRDEETEYETFDGEDLHNIDEELIGSTQSGDSLASVQSLPRDNAGGGANDDDDNNDDEDEDEEDDLSSEDSLSTAVTAAECRRRQFDELAAETVNGCGVGGAGDEMVDSEGNIVVIGTRHIDEDWLNRVNDTISSEFHLVGGVESLRDLGDLTGIRIENGFAGIGGGGGGGGGSGGSDRSVPGLSSSPTGGMFDVGARLRDSGGSSSGSDLRRDERPMSLISNSSTDTGTLFRLLLRSAQDEIQDSRRVDVLSNYISSVPPANTLQSVVIVK